MARNVAAGEVKYFASNPPPRTPLATLLRMASSRWGVVHAVRSGKTEAGFGHFEGRIWLGLLRHMALYQVVLLFVAEHADRLRGENLPEVTVEQVARALNVVCHWCLRRRRGKAAVPHPA